LNTGEEWEIELYINYYWWNYWQNYFIYHSYCNFIGIFDTSLYGQLGLNPTVIISVNSSTKNLHIIAQLVFLFFIFCLVFSRYLLTEYFCQYISKELTIENFPTFHWHWQDIYSLLTSNCANWIVVYWHQWLRTNIYNVSHDPKVFSFLQLIFPFSILNKK